MYITITNKNTGKSKFMNATRACEELGIESQQLYDLFHAKVFEYRHFQIIWDVEIVKNRPRGRAYQKGQSGYLTAILSKANHKK